MTGTTVLKTRSGSAPDATQTILEMYQASHNAAHPNFKRWAIEQVRSLVNFHSASWINGVMQGQVPVFHEVFPFDLKPGYWEKFQTLLPIDPLGPKMFTHAGQSFLTTYDDFPAVMVEQWMKPFEVCHAISGMAADPLTGVFSVVCWHRSPDMPPFTETDRLLHQQLLPHWVRCLNAHRVQQTLADLHLMAREDHQAALLEPNGLIHYAQAGFGELLRRDFPDWLGSRLPQTLLDALSADTSRHEGQQVITSRQSTSTGLWLLHIRQRTATDSLTPREKEVAQLLSQGLSVKLAARSLGIAPATADNMRAAVYRKLEVNNRASLAALVRPEGGI